MDKLRKSARVSIILGFLSVVSILMSHLALTDISHGEGDLSSEWTVLQISFAVFIIFHIFALTTLIKLYRYPGSKPEDPE